MAFSLLSSVGVQGIGPSNTTGAIDTTGAKLLVLSASGSSAEPSFSPSDSKSNTWVPLTQQESSLPANRLWYCIDPIVGTGHTFTLATNNGHEYYGGPVVEAWAADGSITFGGESGSFTNSGGATSRAPGSLTPSVDNSLLVTGYAPPTSGSGISIDSGFTKDAQSPTPSGSAYTPTMGYLLQSTAAAVNPTWSLGSGSGSQATTMAWFYETAGSSNAPLQLLTSAQIGFTPGR